MHTAMVLNAWPAHILLNESQFSFNTTIRYRKRRQCWLPAIRLHSVVLYCPVPLDTGTEGAMTNLMPLMAKLVSARSVSSRGLASCSGVNKQMDLVFYSFLTRAGIVVVRFGGFPPNFHEFPTPLRSVQMYCDNGSIYEGVGPLESVKIFRNQPKMAIFQPRECSVRSIPDQYVQGVHMFCSSIL